MNGQNEKLVMGILLCVLMLNACRTVTPIDTSETDLLAIDVMETQTEITAEGKDLESTINDIKEITDTAKTTVELSKEKIIKVIEYVDKSASQVKTLNETIAKQTGIISSLEKLRITDNSESAKVIADKQTEIDKQKIKASIFYKWAIIATGIALVLAGILWLPKLLKLIY